MNNKSYHHGNLRLALIEAGIRLINKEGINSLSLRKVAALCEVSHTAPYSHFKNKEGLIEAIGEHISNLFVQVFEDILLVEDNNNPVVLNKIGEAYFNFFMKYPQYFTFLFMSGNPKINLSIKDEKHESFPAFQIFKDTAFRIFKTVGMTDEEAEDMIIIKWAFIHGFTSIASMKNISYDKDWKIKINQFLCEG